MTRLVLVEDHILVRQSIRGFLESAGFEVVGEAGTGTDAVAIVMKLNPDLVIMDIHLPEMSGIEAARQIRRQRPDVRIIALTAYNEKAYQRALLEVGVDGFVLKTAEFSVLLKTIQQVINRKNNTPVPIIQPPDDSTNHLLTERELEVLTCAARGWASKKNRQSSGNFRSDCPGSFAGNLSKTECHQSHRSSITCPATGITPQKPQP